MKNKKIKLIFNLVVIMILLSGCGNTPQEEFVIPPIPLDESRVYVEPEIAGVLSSEALKSIEEKNKYIENSLNGVQVGIYMGETTYDTPIEIASSDTFNKWRIGDKDKDNGILIFNSIKDKEVFISTGGGIEGEITDLLALDLIDKCLIPNYKEEKYGEGILEFLDELTEVLESKESKENYTKKTKRMSREEKILIVAFLLFFIVVYICLVDEDGYSSSSSFSLAGGRSFGGSFGGGRSFGGGARGSW